MFFTAVVAFVCAMVFSPMPSMIVMIASAQKMIRVLTNISVVFFFIGSLSLTPQGQWVHQTQRCPAEENRQPAAIKGLL
jgi:hypothetical protein